MRSCIKNIKFTLKYGVIVMVMLFHNYSNAMQNSGNFNEAVVFDRVAAKLLSDIGSSNKTKIAIQPLQYARIGISEAVGMRLDSAIYNALNENLRGDLRLVSRSNLMDAWKEIEQFDDIDLSARVNDAKADWVVVGKGQMNSEGLQLSYQLLSLKNGEIGRVLSVATARPIPQPYVAGTILPVDMAAIKVADDLSAVLTDVLDKKRLNGRYFRVVFDGNTSGGLHGAIANPLMSSLEKQINEKMGKLMQSGVRSMENGELPSLLLQTNIELWNHKDYIGADVVITADGGINVKRYFLVEISENLKPMMTGLDEGYISLRDVHYGKKKRRHEKAMRSLDGFLDDI